jgi:2'-5' RNA ligase
MQQFIGKYKNLQKGRWFFTVWVALPEESREIIKNNIKELQPYCEWLSTMAGNHSKDIPHVSLRYLGFSDELKHEDVKKDKELFENALKEVQDFDIEVGKVNLWTRQSEGIVTVARLNWQITKPEPFIAIHKALLKVPGYYLFEELEQENYNPHISLGAINMENYSNYEIVKEYLDKKNFKKNRFTLKNFALNLTSPERTEVIPLQLS